MSLRRRSGTRDRQIQVRRDSTHLVSPTHICELAQGCKVSRFIGMTGEIVAPLNIGSGGAHIKNMYAPIWASNSRSVPMQFGSVPTAEQAQVCGCLSFRAISQVD